MEVMEGNQRDQVDQKSGFEVVLGDVFEVGILLISFVGGGEVEGDVERVGKNEEDFREDKERMF